jgi:hypothetical protein
MSGKKKKEWFTLNPGENQMLKVSQFGNNMIRDGYQER